MSIRARIALLVGILLAVTIPLFLYLLVTFAGTRQSLREARTTLAEFNRAVETGVHLARARARYLDVITTGETADLEAFSRAVHALEVYFERWTQSSRASIAAGVEAESEDLDRIQALQDQSLAQARSALRSLELHAAGGAEAPGPRQAATRLLATDALAASIETITEEELAELGGALDSVLLHMGSTPWISRRGPELLQTARATLQEVRAVARMRSTIIDQAEQLSAYLIEPAPEMERALLRSLIYVESADKNWRSAADLYAMTSGESAPPHAAAFSTLNAAYQAEIEMAVHLTRSGALPQARALAASLSKRYLEGVLLPITEDGLTVELAETTEALDRIHDITGAAGAMGVTFFLAVTVVSMLLFLATVRHLVRSLDQLRHGLDVLGAGDLEHRLHLTARDEFGHLARAIDNMAGQLRDQVERRNALEQELLQSARMATLGQVIATVSHELRNPLGTIGTAVHTLRKQLGGSAPEIDRVLSRTQRSVARCDAIIEELLDYVRNTNPRPVPTAMDAWTEGVLEDLSVDPAIMLNSNLGAGVTVSFDRNRLQGCLTNVVANACQAMLERQDGCERNILTVETRVSGDRVEWVVTDTGPGMASEVYERILEPMFSTRPFGVGLGLPIVRKYLEQHAGGVEVVTAPGRGTRVVLWLPAPKEPLNAAP